MPAGPKTIETSEEDCGQIASIEAESDLRKDGRRLHLVFCHDQLSVIEYQGGAKNSYSKKLKLEAGDFRWCKYSKSFAVILLVAKARKCHLKRIIAKQIKKSAVSTLLHFLRNEPMPLNREKLFGETQTLSAVFRPASPGSSKGKRVKRSTRPQKGLMIDPAQLPIDCVEIYWQTQTCLESLTDEQQLALARAIEKEEGWAESDIELPDASPTLQRVLTAGGKSAKHLTPITLQLADADLPEWRDLYPKELKQCVEYCHAAKKHLLPQVLILDNTRLKRPLRDFRIRQDLQGFTTPKDIRAFTDAVFRKRYQSNDSWTDQENLRLFDLNGRELLVQKVRYEEYLRTNMVLDEQRMKGLDTLRHVVHPHGRLDALRSSPLANHIGINILVLTAEGSLVLEKRAKDISIRPGQLCSAASGAFTIWDMTLPTSLDNVHLFRECCEELGLSTANIVEGRFDLLGVTRELIRGGKPEIFLSVHVNLTQAEVESKWGRAKDKSESEMLEFYPFDPRVALDLLTTDLLQKRFSEQFDELLRVHGKMMSLPLLTNLALWQMSKMTERSKRKH